MELKSENYRKMNEYLLKSGIKILKGTNITRFKVVNEIYNQVISSSMPNKVQIQGRTMYLDKNDHKISLSIALNGIWDETITKLIKNFVKRGDITLDIGAHIGYYTLLLANIVENGKVIAFEPDPRNFSFLKKNCEANGYSNVSLVNKAVFKETKKLRLFLHEEDGSGHSLFIPNKENNESIIVDSVKLDDFKGINKLNFIKLDAEGSEYWILKGAYETLKNNPDLIIITEYSPLGLRKSGVKPDNYIKELQKLDFKLYDINEISGTINPISKKMDYFTNLLCLKGKYQNNFENMI